MIRLIEGAPYVLGASRGRNPVGETPLLANIIAEADVSVVNPARGEILSQMRRVADFRGQQPDLTLPWDRRYTKPDARKVFQSIISFSDDHDGPIHNELFPVEESIAFTRLVRDTSRSLGRGLTVAEQFEVATSLTGNPFAAAVVCHSGSRALGRNRDQRVSSSFVFPNHEIAEWANSVAHFEVGSPTPDLLGDNYHFWACATMGIAIKANEEDAPLEMAFYKGLTYNGARVMAFVRNNIARQEIEFLHGEVDRIGLQVGLELLES